MFLSIDTFSDNFGVAIIKDNKVLVIREYLKPKPFSEVLMPEIQDIFNKLKIEPSQLKGVIVNQGLGSNTGLRVGLITAKTLAYSLNINLYYFRTLDVMVYKYRHFCGDVVAVLNIGKSNVAYKINENEPVITSFEEFKIQFEKKENSLIIEKNLNLDWNNCISLKTSLCVDGGFYALERDLKADPFLLEPIYHE
ncbi:tRNA (adenosine(37)-N6)-threonylcarbamoyltransferase complex dimerization subunit type 1 TsaB [Sulfurihydrogenibium sp.]|uniref:tRNA (adenosine(37)-N6)-threonylcarbamoyltransferase complex dimerization subunit type 1 TsaB n=1 Tax=Sulfurihydrogenibium sp. TaxID=2053621 RepID=UPI00260A52D7|nr:tRNA (adenosine(37)-N6)-threonylcarbamoyltransferase complex dimerization subunit type 1 TsaB [Sulfurihydrogenibium sp.]